MSKKQATPHTLYDAIRGREAEFERVVLEAVQHSLLAMGDQVWELFGHHSRAAAAAARRAQIQIPLSQPNLTISVSPIVDIMRLRD